MVTSIVKRDKPAHNNPGPIIPNPDSRPPIPGPSKLPIVQATPKLLISFPRLSGGTTSPIIALAMGMFPPKNQSMMRDRNNIPKMVEKASTRNPTRVPNWQINRMGFLPTLSDMDPQKIFPKKQNRELVASSNPTCVSVAPKLVVNWGRYGIRMENPMISMKVHTHNGVRWVNSYCFIRKRIRMVLYIFLSGCLAKDCTKSIR